MISATTVMRKYNACPEAIAWAGRKSAKGAWEQCQRGDWLLWLAGRAGIDRKVLVRAACEVARTALRYVPKGEDRPRLAIETTLAWCDGTATLAEVRKAAAAGAAAGAAALAAGAVALAAGAAEAAAYAAAAEAAWDAAGAAARAAARAASLKHSADLVRARIPWALIEEKLT